MFRRLFAPALALALLPIAHAQPLTTAFTYQGDLTTAGAPATGTYDLRFRLFDALAGGSQQGPTLCSDNISVAGGAFTAQLDFGSQFTGQQRFLEIEVRLDTGLPCGNATGFTTLTPRQPLTAAPSASFSLNAAAATTAASASNSAQLNGQPAAFYTNAANLSGALPSASLAGAYSAQLNLSNINNIFSGTFGGSGAGLTGIPWSGITGAPPIVALQNPFPGLSQSGNLNLTGRGHFGEGISIGTLSGLYPLDVSGPVRVMNDGSDGDAIRIGSTNDKPMGITKEVGEILNLAMNFHIANANTANAGAAIRVDGRFGQSPIQLITRPPGSTTETIGLRVNTNGHVAVGTIFISDAAFSVTDAGFASAPISGEFLTNNNNGIALSARAPFTAGSTTCFQAQNDSPTGVAAALSCTSFTGANTTLQANSNSPAGTAGVFQGAGADVVLINNTSSAGRGLHVACTGTALWAECGSPTDAFVLTNSGAGRGAHITANSDTALWAECATGFAGIDARNGSTTGRAVYGFATAATGTTYGVNGAATSPNGFGVFATGRTGASGTKSFRIDHPADPEHKYLLHYSTESPEVLNFYSGKVILNEQGEATIELPAYFARINKDPRYLLTPIGAAMPLLHIAEEVSDEALAQGEKASPTDPVPTCSFRIAGGAPNAKISWRVDALRNDRWVQAHGAPVEVAKQGPEDGTYQHPDLYNQPAQALPAPGNDH